MLLWGPAKAVSFFDVKPPCADIFFYINFRKTGFGIGGSLGKTGNLARK